MQFMNRDIGKDMKHSVFGAATLPPISFTGSMQYKKIIYRSTRPHYIIGGVVGVVLADFIFASDCGHSPRSMSINLGVPSEYLHCLF